MQVAMKLLVKLLEINYRLNYRALLELVALCVARDMNSLGEYIDGERS